MIKAYIGLPFVGNLEETNLRYRISLLKHIYAVMHTGFCAELTALNHASVLTNAWMPCVKVDIYVNIYTVNCYVNMY